MPRVSLPSSIKNLKTYEVLVTQTTEADLRSHFKNLFALFEAGKDKYTKRISDVVGMFFDENPYANRDWKKHIPTRHYKESFAWFGENETEIQEYFGFSNLFSDLNLIAKHYQWEELEDMKYEIEKFNTYISSGQSDLLQLETCRFLQAKKTFEEENKEWIEEQTEIKKHKRDHPTGYTLRVQAEEGQTIDLSCQYCKISYDKEVELIKRVREYSALIEQTYEVKAKPVETKPYVKPVDQVCEDCGFKSHHKSVFDYHIQEPHHKKVIQLKTWYCSCCEVQCQSQIKHDEHLETTKHKKNAGEIQKQTYSCEKCNYETKFKHHYDQHLESKKHKE